MNTDTNVLVNLLLDIKDIMVYTRFKITDPIVVDILETLKNYITDYLLVGDIHYEPFVNKMNSLYNLELKRNVLDIDNKRVNNAKRYLPMILTVIIELQSLIQTSNFNRAYDLVDCIHCLPEALLSKKWNPKKYWNTYINFYRKRWDKSFLIKEKILFKSFSFRKKIDNKQRGNNDLLL